jgi:HEAT repeat protein
LSKSKARRRDTIVHRIAALSARNVRRNIDEVTSLVQSHWPEVRLVAVEALIRGATGVSDLRSALKDERNDVVLAAICEGLLLLGDKQSVPQLKELAQRHSSPLVRQHAAWAVAWLMGRQSVSFLRRLQRIEHSRRVRATIKAGLVKNGEYEELHSLLHMLRSRDYLVRTSVANFFEHNISVTRNADVVAEHLQKALNREETVAAGAALRKAIHTVQPKRPGKEK